MKNNKNITILFFLFTMLLSCNRVDDNIEEKAQNLFYNTEDLRGLPFHHGIDKILDENSITHLDTIGDITPFKIKWGVDSILVLKDSKSGFKQPMRFFKKRIGLLRKVGLLDVSDLGFQNLKRFISRDFDNKTQRDEIITEIDKTLDIYFNYANYHRVKSAEDLRAYLNNIGVEYHKHLLRLLNRKDFYLYAKHSEHKSMIAVSVNIHVTPSTKIINLDDLFDWGVIDINVNESDFILDQLFL